MKTLINFLFSSLHCGYKYNIGFAAKNFQTSNLNLKVYAIIVL